MTGILFRSLKGIVRRSSSVFFTPAHIEVPSAPLPETKTNVIVGQTSAFAAVMVKSWVMRE